MSLAGELHWRREYRVPFWSRSRHRSRQPGPLCAAGPQCVLTAWVIPHGLSLSSLSETTGIGQIASNLERLASGVRR